MASFKRWLPMALVAVLSAGCFHQVVQTGRSASSTVVDKPWVPMWIFGLVQAQPIETRPLCPTGIATVETETSFLNGLVGGVTLGIFTPMARPHHVRDQHLSSAARRQGAHHSCGRIAGRGTGDRRARDS